MNLHDHLTLWNDAGLLREDTARRFGRVLLHGGSVDDWSALRRRADRLARLSGRSHAEVMADLIDDARAPDGDGEHA